MNRIISIIVIVFSSLSAAHSADANARQFLRYIYGQDGIEITNVCHWTDDVWMLRGAKNSEALAELDTLKMNAKPTGVTSGTVARDIYFIETREGKVDPAFNLDGVYVMHRQLVLQFIYASLSQDRRMLGQVVSDASNVKIEGRKAASGDMDQYASIIQMMPVVRCSKPADDAKSRTITYRVPLGEEILMLTLAKNGSTWKIDTTKPVRVPLTFFFEEK